MSRWTKRTTYVEISPATAPDGRIMVLLQVGDAFHALWQPDDARDIADRLTRVADQIESRS